MLHLWAESGWARSAAATWAFAQSSIVPGPGDAMMLPLGLADPRRVFSLASWSTVGSFVGALGAYSIGFFAFDSVGLPLVAFLGIGMDRIQAARAMFAEHGWLVVLVSSVGVVPVPAKLMSMAAGAFGLPVLLFAPVILVGRGARFFVEAALIRFAGLRLSSYIERKASRPLAALR